MTISNLASRRVMFSLIGKGTLQLDKTLLTIGGLDDQASYAKDQRPVTLNLDLLLQEDTRL